MKKLKILALNPFHGGSHKAFLDNWIQSSCHEWTLLTLPDTQWRWRLHFAAVELSREIHRRYEAGERWDVIFTTSMLNVAELRGLCPEITGIPLVTYFHENQLTYPENSNVKYNLGRSMKNINSALAADRVWFNSEFHKTDFLSAARKLLEVKPGSPTDFIDEIELKASVQYLGIEDDFFCNRTPNFSAPVKLVWASRWEEDKNPGLLFMALRSLKKRGIDFRIAILGEEMKVRMQCFEEAKEEFSNEITQFGFAESREKYKEILQESDIFISTADHEFFGIAALEAVASGCIPVVPNHLAYPEVLKDFKEFFYKPRSSVGLVEKIISMIENKPQPDFSGIDKFRWSRISMVLDNEIRTS